MSAEVLQPCPSAPERPGLLTSGVSHETTEHDSAIGLRSTEWRARVAELTAPAREERAKAWDRKARQAGRRAVAARSEANVCALAGVRERPGTTITIHREEASRRWYAARAAGERERFVRADRCGQPGGKGMRIACRSCGSVHEAPLACGSHLACGACRDRWAAHLRKRFLRARTVALEDVGHRMRGWGAWSEKFLTLTIPHLAEMSNAARIATVRAALPRFERRLRRLLRYGVASHELAVLGIEPSRETTMRARRRAWRELAHVRWFRCAEWTPGDDGQGHPHAHFWILCPYVDVEAVRGAWLASLREAGAPLAADAPVIVDLRRARGAAGRIAHELIKYLTKDIAPGGLACSAELYATAYDSLAGVRRTQGSRGFLALAGRVPCPSCKAPGAWDVAILSSESWSTLEAELARLAKENASAHC